MFRMFRAPLCGTAQICLLKKLTAQSLRRRKVVPARGLVRVVAHGKDTARALVIRSAAEAELGATTTRALAARHVIASAALLDAVVAFGTAHGPLLFEVLEQCHLFRLARIGVVLRTRAPRVPSAAVVRASALLAVLAFEVGVRAGGLQEMPVPAPVRAPPEAHVLLHRSPRQRRVVSLKILLVRFALDVRVRKLSTAAVRVVGAKDVAEIPLAG